MTDRFMGPKGVVTAVQFTGRNYPEVGDLLAIVNVGWDEMGGGGLRVFVEPTVAHPVSGDWLVIGSDGKLEHWTNDDFRRFMHTPIAEPVRASE